MLAITWKTLVVYWNFLIAMATWQLLISYTECVYLYMSGNHTSLGISRELTEFDGGITDLSVSSAAPADTAPSHSCHRVGQQQVLWLDVTMYDV